MRKLLSATIICTCMAFGYAGAEELDASSLPSDNRIKTLMYDEADVYTITTRYGYQTNIVFSPQEEIETVSVGDRSLWQIIPSGNRMFIRPMEEDITTNMTVLTNKRAYQFDLKSVAADKTEGNIYVAKFTYKDDKKKTPPPVDAFAAVVAPPAAMPPANVLPPNVTSPFGAGPSVPDGAVAEKPAVMMPPPAMPAASVPSPPPAVYQPAPVTPQAPIRATTAQSAYPNYNYTFAGPDDQAPLQVYDDGKSTYFKYRDVTQPMPSVYLVDPSGKEMPLSSHIRGDFMIVDTVAGELELKNTAGTVHIYNEMLNPR